MSNRTGIEWTDCTWNPIVGCSRVSPGCENCYAEALAGSNRLRLLPQYAGLTRTYKDRRVWSGEVRLNETALELPLHWKHPRRIFVNSMSDMFHERVKPEWIDTILEVMAATPHHTYQVLTKRADLMEEKLYGVTEENPIRELGGGDYFSNLWLGVSAENQKYADARIPRLLQVPAAVRFVSIEPLLGPITFRPKAENVDQMLQLMEMEVAHLPEMLGGIKWVIIGGESGPGHRTMKIEWLESIVEQCDRAGVPVFVKQDSGRFPGKQGRIPDRLWKRKEFPEVRR